MSLIYDRNVLVSSRKEVRTDLAIKYAKAELAGESNLTAKPMPMSSESNRTTSFLLEEIIAQQVKGFSPIIVIPSSANSKSRLTCLNALKFLSQGTYAEPNMRTMSKPSMPLELERKVAGNILRFRIFDDTSKFKKDDWKSVVAVFTDGKRWQFFAWPFRAESDLFQSIQAFNIRYPEDSVEPMINSNRVKSLLLSKTARHSDSSVMMEFWKGVETWLAQPRSRKFSSTQKLA